MAQTKLSPKEFLQDCFPPRLACLWSDDAEEICRKNNLNFIQIIQPFLRSNAEMISSDLTNRRFYMKNFSLHVSTIEQAVAPSPIIARNIFQDRVASCVDEFDQVEAAQLEIPLRNGTLRIPATTPWFEAFRDEYIRLFPACDHECIRDFLGCIFVISSSVVDPVSRAKALIEQQLQQQANHKYPRWFGPNIIKFFIVLDDLSAATDDTKVRAESAMHYFTTTYGEHSCWLLKINSRSKKEDIDPWLSFLHQGDVHMDSGENLSNGDEEEQMRMEGAVDHPLALRPKEDSLHQLNKTALSQREIGLLLGQEDAQGIRDCILALVNKCLIPYAERQIRILNELIISKKGIHRTLVNATKKIFGPSGPSRSSSVQSQSHKSSSNTNLSQIVYAGEAVELQNRKAGDLSFILQLYDQAFQFFQSARRDYSADQAWNYYAAASEMCGLAAFLSPTAGFSSANSRGFPLQYFEAAIKSYTDVSKTSPQSVRATLFATEVCKALHLYSEAATFFKNRSPEDFELLYGLFLEQAGHCYLRLPQAPSPRRFAFQMIFSGFRYFKASQKRLGVLVYKQALKVLEGRGWIVAEDHIRLNIVRYSIPLLLFQESLPHFFHLLTGVQRQVPAQQLLILKDYIACHRAVHGDSGIQEVSIPVILMQKIRSVMGRASETDAHTVELMDEGWLGLEEKTLECKGHATHVFKPQQVVYSDVTDNRNRPVASVGEKITVEIPVRNPLGIPLLLGSLQIEYDFHAKAGLTTSSEEESEAAVQMTVAPSELRLGASETARLTFILLISRPGALMMTGLSYTVTAQSDPAPEREELVRVAARQKFTIRGARLNSSKAEKSAVLHGPDHRLDITVVPPLGKLLARWENFPRGVLSGQVVRLNLIIENEGGRAVDHVSLASSLPDVLVFFNAPKADNIVTLQIPPGGIEPGKRVAMTAVFVAPPVAASYSLRTLLYYETAVEPGGEKDKSPRHRVWRMQHDFEVLPGLTLKGFLLPSVCNRDEVVVSLQIAHVNEMQLQTIPFKLVEILSTNSRWRIDNLCDDDASDGTILTTQETYLTLLGRRVTEPQVDLSAFPVAAELDSTDLNFIKAARSLAGHVSGTPQDFPPDSDTFPLRLLWKVTLTSDGKPTNVYGLRFITFSLDPWKDPAVKSCPDSQGVWKKPGPLAVPDMTEVLNRLPDDPFTTSFLRLPLGEVGEESNFDVVDWRVELPKEEPGLGSGQTVVVPLTIQLSCTVTASSAPEQGEAVVNVTVEFRTAVKCFPLGSRKHTLVLRPGGLVSLKFDYCFTASGTYNLAEFVYVKAICSVIPELKVAKLQKPSTNQMLLRVA